MPHSLGKKTNIAVLTQPEHFDKAKNADLLVNETILNEIKEGKFNFTKLYCTTDSMSLLKPLARILGPKGLMPNSKVGTLVKVEDLEQALKEAKMG